MKNSGFSLVELIVVIAIMAILVGVAVPVYTSYIEEARHAADMDYLANLKTAAQVFATENQIEIGSVVVGQTVTDSQGITLYLPDGTEYEGDLSELYEMIGEYEFKSSRTDKTILIDPEASIPEESSDADVSEDSGNSQDVEECQHLDSELIEEFGNVKKYKCNQCHEEYVDKGGDDIGGT